jgi:Chaperone of endosialidase
VNVLPVKNISEDGLSINPDNKHLQLPAGLQLGNSSSNAGNIPAGTLRFNSGQVQFSNGTDWVNLASGGVGVFQPIGSSGAVAYAGGSVGIGSEFTGTSAPTYRLEVTLGNNTGPADQVRFGNAVCCNGSAAFQTYAYFAHRAHTSNANFGFRQGSSGNVHINAPTGQPISFRQNGGDVRLGITASGRVVIGSEANLPGADQFIFQVAGSAFKNDGQNQWNVVSDIRVKDDIRDLDFGLAHLMQVRPVRFRYNGKAGTPVGQECVGVIGQEIEKILPETISRVPTVEGLEDEDLRIYNGSTLTYVLVNAVKELATKVQQLEAALADSRKQIQNLEHSKS